MKFGLLGSGSWATAIAKILTDNNHSLSWWFRNKEGIEFIKTKKHNKNYLSKVFFDTSKIEFYDDVKYLVENVDYIILAIPSIHLLSAIDSLPSNIFKNKFIISAVKGVLPNKNQLVNDYLLEKYEFQIEQYFTLLGPCHAEEVAQELVSYLTFSGVDKARTQIIANAFTNEYIYTRINEHFIGVQYAAVLKNIYALGSGIVDGLGYGDNFLSGFITNCANEMNNVLSALIEFHNHEKETYNFLQTVYLGDLLVTCYSLHSRNRKFGKLIGKGYSVKTAQLELDMIAEGHNASKCIYILNQQMNLDIPIIRAIYQILWEDESPKLAFEKLESLFN